jgi:hypothetical protein
MFKTLRKHEHGFTDYAPRAVGYWQKRECPGDGVYFSGKVQECKGCGILRFIPADPRLQAVECTIASDRL